MKRNGGFTLIELVVVIIIVGILAAMGFTQYTKMVEKGRTAEAKSVLGSLRAAQRARHLEVGTYTNVIANLPVEAPTACTATHFYSYTCAATGACTANRCTAGGKTPNAAATHSITLDIAGAWSGTAGYF
ncbi:MAG: prepilin-type N-terminal cleavage/methylation domain-containing protein [Candidatus Omnitrophica bacterium]|nr:prepilin-type N-terminal cleavage/methylation domain-containing protein [Candidatus Omnitrophota bacterium]